MIEARRLKNVVIFIQTILSFVLSRKTIVLHIRKTQFDLLISKPINKQIKLLEKTKQNRIFFYIMQETFYDLL